MFIAYSFFYAFDFEYEILKHLLFSYDSIFLVLDYTVGYQDLSFYNIKERRGRGW